LRFGKLVCFWHIFHLLSISLFYHIVSCFASFSIADWYQSPPDTLAVSADGQGYTIDGFAPNAMVMTNRNFGGFYGDGSISSYAPSNQEEADGSALRTALIFWYIGNEGISLIENAVLLGVPVPDALKNALAQIKNRGEKPENKNEIEEDDENGNS
jgi:hypothetical protein